MNEKFEPTTSTEKEKVEAGRTKEMTRKEGYLFRAENYNNMDIWGGFLCITDSGTLSFGNEYGESWEAKGLGAIQKIDQYIDTKKKIIEDFKKIKKEVASGGLNHLSVDLGDGNLLVYKNRTLSRAGDPFWEIRDDKVVLETVDNDIDDAEGAIGGLEVLKSKIEQWTESK